MSRLTLDTIERGLRAGLTEARELVATPAAALAVAERLLRDDTEATEEFAGRADLLAGYLRHVAAHGRVDEETFAAELSDADREALWLADWERSVELRDEFGADRDAYLAFCRSEQRLGRLVAPRAAPPEDRAAAATATPAAQTAMASMAVPAPAAAPAAAPAPSTATAKLAATSARLSLAECSATLGVGRLDALPRGAVMLALRQAGIAWTENADGEMELAREDVQALAADSARLDALCLALTRCVPRLGHAAGGAVAIGGRR